MGSQSNGEGGIRTLGELAPTLVFETSTIGHSVTSPISRRLWGTDGGGGMIIGLAGEWQGSRPLSLRIQKILF